MPKVLLTDVSLRALKAESQADFWDTKTPGFGVRVGKRSKTFVAKLYNRRSTIGSYPALSLQDARRKFLELKVSADPSAPLVPRYDETIRTYLINADIRPSTKREADRLLNKHFPFGGRSLADIETSEIVATLDRLRPTPSECLHAFRAIRTFFRWAVRRRLLDRSPCENMDPPTKEVVKDRVLDQNELIAVWKAAGDAGYPFGTMIRLLILTGARRAEIGRMEWSWIDFEARTWTVPAEVAKNGRRHTLPFGDVTAAIFSSIPRKSKYLFPARGSDKAFSGYSSSFEQFRKRLPNVARFSPHDLRRTFASILAAPPISARLEVIERALNHLSGSFGGIVSVYQKHSFMPEMREVFEKWEAKLKALVS